MINMSYCRFENTYHALVECERELEEISEITDRLDNLREDSSLDELSDSEKKYAKRLIQLCEEIYEDFSTLVE